MLARSVVAADLGDLANDDDHDDRSIAANFLHEPRGFIVAA